MGKILKYIYIDLSKNIDFCNELSRKRTASKYERKLRKIDCKFHRVIIPTGDCINNIIERNKIDVYLTNDSKSMELYSDNEIIKRLTQLCEEKLEETSRPAEYHVIDVMPTTQAGKVDYKRMENERNMISQIGTGKVGNSIGKKYVER